MIRLILIALTLFIASQAWAEPRTGPIVGGVVVPSASSGGFFNNFITNPQWNYVNSDNVASAILVPCEEFNPCIIGQSNTWPTTTSATMDAWISGGGYDTYPGNAVSSYSTINGADDVVINAQLSWASGCRHCKIAAVQGTSGHLGVGPGSLNFIGGELQYSFIIASHDSSILGPDYTNKSSFELIAGGELNLIDWRTVTNTSLGSNSIFGGNGNEITATSTAGCQGCGIYGGRFNTITNESANPLTSAAIVGGFRSEVRAITGEIPPDGSFTTGDRGSSWMPHQRTHGGGVGYSASDDGPGALQSFELLWRQDTTASDSYQTLSASASSDIHLLAYAGVYKMSGELTCTDQADITTVNPTQLEVWDFDGIMMWTGGAATPQFVDSVDTTADGTHDLTTSYVIGGANTWEARVIGGTNGDWRVQVTPGTDVDPLYCFGKMEVTQSRQGSS